MRMSAREWVQFRKTLHLRSEEGVARALSLMHKYATLPVSRRRATADKLDVDALARNASVMESSDKPSIVVTLRNAAHPSKPVEKGVIRAFTHFSGTVLVSSKNILPKAQGGGGAADVMGTMMYTCNASDMGGQLPAFLINYTAPRFARSWCEKLRKSVTEEHKKREEK